jgi:hypothetical protein
MADARQWRDKHLSASMNSHAAMKELLGHCQTMQCFSMQFMPRIYKAIKQAREEAGLNTSTVAL